MYSNVFYCHIKHCLNPLRCAWMCVKPSERKEMISWFHLYSAQLIFQTKKKYWQILGFLSFFFTVIQKSIIKQASLSKIENIANIGRLEAKAKYIGRLEILRPAPSQIQKYAQKTSGENVHRNTFKTYCNPRFNRWA